MHWAAISILVTQAGKSMGKLGGGGFKKTMLTLTINDNAGSHKINRPFIKKGDLFVLNKIDQE